MNEINIFAQVYVAHCVLPYFFVHMTSTVRHFGFMKIFLRWIFSLSYAYYIIVNAHLIVPIVSQHRWPVREPFINMDFLHVFFHQNFLGSFTCCWWVHIKWVCDVLLFYSVSHPSLFLLSVHFCTLCCILFCLYVHHVHPHQSLGLYRR